MKGKAVCAGLILQFLIVALCFAEENTWAQKADKPTAIINMQNASVLNGKIYVFGGSDGTKTLSVVEVYDPNTDTWSTISDMPTDRAAMPTCVVNEKIYVIGGGNLRNGQFSWLSTVEEYDPETDTWSTKADMPRPTTLFPACEVDGKIYAIGGNNNLTYHKNIVVYDPSIDTWELKAEIPTPRNGLSACYMNGKIYTIGGWRTGYGCMKVVEVYDIGSDTWSKKTGLPFTIGYHTSFAVNGKILIISGEASDAGPLYSSVYEYDPETETINEKAEIPAARAYFASAMVDGKIYVIGGTSNPPHSGMEPASQVFMYDPGPGGPTFVEISNPTEFSLSQNYPNPFNPSTVIKYSLDRQGLVNLIIYDILGFKVDTLVDANQGPGTYSVRWNADGLASGMYFYRLDVSGAKILTQKMMLMK